MMDFVSLLRRSRISLVLFFTSTLGWVFIFLFSHFESRGYVHFTFPLWPLLFLFAITMMILLVIIARKKIMMWHELVLFSLFPGLTILMTLLFLQRSVWTPGEYWYVALWAVTAGWVVATSLKKPLSRRQVATLGFFAIIFVVVTSAFNRFDVHPLLLQTALLVTAFFWSVLLWLLPRFSTFARDRAARWERWWWLGAIIIVVIWGAWLRISALTAFPLQNDEFFHIDAARGYLQSGEYRLWDYQTQTLGVSYNRAWPFTWQVAQSMRLFGATEWVFRLPSLVWGMLFVIGAGGLTFFLTRSHATTFFLTAIVSFDQGFIWAATTTRMYAMFSVLALLIIAMTVRACAPPPLSARARSWWFGCAVALAILSVVIHPTALLLLVGIGFALCVSALRYPSVQWFWITLVVLAIPALATLPFFSFFQELLQARFFTLRTDVNTQYLLYPFQNFIMPMFALTIVIIGLFTQRARQWIMVFVSMALPALLYFAYLAPRYGARKYSMFVFIALFIIIAHEWHRVQYALWRNVYWRTVGSVALFAFCFLPIAVPGFRASWFLKSTRADQPLDQLQFHDYPAAYAFLAAHVDRGEIILMLSPRSFYLQETDLQIVQIPSEKKMTVTDLQELITKNPRGWIVWPQYKSYHLSGEVQQFIQRRFEKVDDAIETNIIMYHYDVSDDVTTSFRTQSTNLERHLRS